MSASTDASSGSRTSASCRLRATSTTSAQRWASTSASSEREIHRRLQSVRTRPDVVFRLLGNAAVLVDLSSNEIFELNETGAAIWTLLSEGQAPAGIADELVRRYAIDRAAAEAETHALVER